MQEVRRSILTGTLVLSAAGLFSAGAKAQTVKVNWQENAPFATYKTYAWQGSKNEGSDFYKQWIHTDVNEEMARKHFREVSPNQDPDLLLYYHVISQEIMDSTTTDDGYGWGQGPWGFWGGWGGWGVPPPGIARTEVQPRMMGILAIDIVDARTKDLVWRGQATVDAISNKQKGDEKQTLNSVRKMFAKFPPRNKDLKTKRA